MWGLDIKDWYKLKKKINIKIKWILRLLKFSDFVYWINLVNTGKIELLYDWEYDFDNEDYKDLFSDILALDYMWAINLEVKNIDSRDNWNYKTNLIKNTHPYSLYNTFLKDRNQIEDYSSMQIEIKYMTHIFLREFMKVIYQEKKVDKLPNYKILDELIEYIKSEIWWKSSFLWKIGLFYDLDTYLKESHSIYPILIELEKLWYLEVFDLELKEWKIVFKIKNISKIDWVEKEKIIDIFWSTDKYKVNKNLNKETKDNANSNDILLSKNIKYDIDKLLFKNISNNLSYEIPKHYSKFMNILLENRWMRVSYDDICKYINEDDISDWTYKWNLIKLLRNNYILGDNETIIKWKNKWYILL